MTTLELDWYRMPGARLGGENPLPPLGLYRAASADIRRGAAGHGAGEAGAPDRILPYLLQDQYDRTLSPGVYRTAVLENEFLRAVFLLDLGGRLWSLVHKPTARELLMVNPVFQPANLAIRDAWFSGGVEWNLSIIGHCPFTCSPLFAARVIAEDGSPSLRLYEWERVRGVAWQVDFILPPGSQYLFVRPRIVNPHDHEVRMYWWSNIAVPEREDVRVISPAQGARRHDYDGGLIEHDLPNTEGVDATYTTRRRNARDMYFIIPPGQRPWVAALDGQGRGLVQCSTSRLCGRKAFNWGMSAGGRRWQEFLACPGEAYLEIQAGLAQTQTEYVPMPGRTTWDWLEAYGLMEADPAQVHGTWEQARAGVQLQTDQALPQPRLDHMWRQTAGLADRAPAELLHRGSGWGALEQCRREVAGERSISTAATPFLPDHPDAAQRPWLQLLHDGSLPEHPVDQPPISPLVQPQWRRLLEASVTRPEGNHWLAWYQLGIMRLAAGETASAVDAWRRSTTAAPSAWAWRNLGFVARDTGDLDEAASCYLAALALMPDLLPLVVECGQVLLDAGRSDRILKIVDGLEPPLRLHGRVRLLEARAALACGDLERVASYFDDPPDIPNMQEKETSLSDLWIAYHEARMAAAQAGPLTESQRRQVRREFPVPQRLDFRLREEAAGPAAVTTERVAAAASR